MSRLDGIKARSIARPDLFLNMHTDHIHTEYILFYTPRSRSLAKMDELHAVDTHAESAPVVGAPASLFGSGSSLNPAAATTELEAGSATLPPMSIPPSDPTAPVGLTAAAITEAEPPVDSSSVDPATPSRPEPRRLETFPPEVFLEVVKYLDPVAKFQLSKTTRWFRALLHPLSDADKLYVLKKRRRETRYCLFHRRIDAEHWRPRGGR